MDGVCPACGATARLGPDGVCAWRAGCEHRQEQADAMERRIDAATEIIGGMTGAAAAPSGEPGMTPYLTDLWTYHERACEALGGPVCVHCVALAN